MVGGVNIPGNFGGDYFGLKSNNNNNLMTPK